MGKFDDRHDTEQATLEQAPPDVYAECRQVLARWHKQRKPWPAMMDRNWEVAARWWTDEMQEPYDDRTERPRLTATTGQTMGERWIAPYQDRVRRNLQIFLAMPEKRQRFVVSAREDGHWWRGEHENVWHHGRKVWLFLLVVGESELAFQLSPEDYRFEAVRWMKANGRMPPLPYDKRKSLSGV